MPALLSGISKSQVSKLCKEIDERVNAFRSGSRPSNLYRYQNIGHALHMRLFALTPSSLDDLKGSNQRAGLIVEGMPSGFDAFDHPGFLVFGKRPQHFGKFVSCFLLRH